MTDWIGHGSVNDTPEEIVRLYERRPAPGERILEGPILHLDTHRPPVSDLAEDGEESPPRDVAEAGELRDVVLERRGEDPHVIEPLPVDAGILGMDMDETVGELDERPNRIHLLPDQM